MANPQLAIPRLFDQMFPSWFAGITFAAIAVGALVPAAIMSIAAAKRSGVKDLPEILGESAAKA